MNKRRTVFLSSGLPSMFVIFSILCMVILSLLALGTSRQDLQTSQMSLDQTTAYYKACSDATAQYTEITEYIRKTAESASDKERYLSQMKNLEKNFKNTVWSQTVRNLFPHSGLFRHSGSLRGSKSRICRCLHFA